MSFSNHVDITVANLHPKLEFMKLVLTYLLVMFFLGSCTMQKRMHRPGWHVQWNSKTRTAKTVTEKLPRELISKDGNIEKSTEELSEVTFDLEREDLSSVELIENQSKLEVAPIEQTDFGNDGPPSEQILYEVSQKEGELDSVESEKPQKAGVKSKDRKSSGILFAILSGIGLTLAIIFLGASLGLTELAILVIAAIFGFLFLLISVMLLSRSKKKKITE